MPVYPDTTPDPGSAGALLDQPYAYEFRGLRFGTGTDFITEKVDGVLGMPKTDSNDFEKQFDHGAYPGMVVMGKRVIDFDMFIVGSMGTEIEGKLAIARQTFQAPRRRNPRHTDPFLFWRPGQPKKFVNGRCIRRDFTSEFKTARGIAEGSVEIECPDPIIYSLDEYSVNITPVGGTGQATAHMGGDLLDGAEPIITITGPVDTAIIENQTDDDRGIRLDLDIALGETAVVDVRNEIVYIEGVRNSTVIRADNQWWALVPGDNLLVYTRQGGTDSSQVTVTWRNVFQ